MYTVSQQFDKLSTTVGTFVGENVGEDVGENVGDNVGLHVDTVVTPSTTGMAAKFISINSSTSQVTFSVALQLGNHHSRPFISAMGLELVFPKGQCSLGEVALQLYNKVLLSSLL